MIVIDASAMMRAIVQTTATPAVVAALDRDEAVAPDILAAELANGLWRYVRAGEMSADAAQMLLATALKTVRLMPVTPELLSHALGLACSSRHPVYDCLYLSLAQRERAPLMTADLRLAERARQLRIGVELLP